MMQIVNVWIIPSVTAVLAIAAWVAWLLEGRVEKPVNDREKFAAAKQTLQFCPSCARNLVRHATRTDLMSCPQGQGDFLLQWREGVLSVEWHARVKTAKASKIRHDLLDTATGLYNTQVITFLEAAQMITYALGKEFPNEPTEQDRKAARRILDGYPPEVAHVTEDENV